MTAHFVGFLSPIYTRTFVDSATGATLNLTGATNISMFMVNISNPQLSKQCTGTWTIANQSTNLGQASYQWTTRDMDTAGNWLLYVSVQLASETNPRELSIDLVSIDPDPSNGGMIVSTQDFNLMEFNGNPLNNSNPIPTIPQTSSTATLIQVTANISSVSLLAANTSRKGSTIYNNGTGNLFMAYGATASTSAFTMKIPPNVGYELPTRPLWQGAISGIWDATGGNAQLTEVV